MIVYFYIQSIFRRGERDGIRERGGEIHVYFRPRNANVTGFKSIRCERSDLIIPRSRHLLHYNSADRAPLCVHKAVQLSGNYYSDLPFQRCCCSVLRVVYCIVILFDENKLCVRVQTIFFFACKLILFFFFILLNKFLNQYFNIDPVFPFLPLRIKIRFQFFFSFLKYFLY